MIRVFLSSVSSGMEATRGIIQEDLRTARYEVVGMETFGARGEPPIDVCFKELRPIDVVVVIIGPQYGSRAPGGEISYTHAEFREARLLGISVLAFKTETLNEPDEVKKLMLQNFIEEVGNTVTYKTAPQDQLSGKILASLTAARERGEIEYRYRIFQPWGKFFQQELEPNALFNHRVPFIGREAELKLLKEFTEGNEPLLLLEAPGGTGKSRLLLEMAKTAEPSHRVLFIDSGAEWSADDIHGLPSVPTILIADDAHRRPDLDRLIAACKAQNEAIRFIISYRPGALAIVTPHLRGLASPSGSPPPIVLSPLSEHDSSRLAELCLGPEFAHLAGDLIRIADQNPLVISVGAKCIANGRVLPNVLSNSSEQFRTVVLDHLLEDPALDSRRSKTRRDSLQLLAAIGPANVEDETTMESCAVYLDIPRPEVAQQIDELERAGLLQRRGRLVRITPDVLGDHLLSRAAVDSRGKPTRFVEQVLQRFASGYLGNILVNASELDWRATQTRQHEQVLTETWRALRKDLSQLTNNQRLHLLRQLKRPAVFAPEQVLEIVEWLCEHPDAPPEPTLEEYGLDDLGEDVRRSAWELLGFIATHPHYTSRCLLRLWPVAQSDDRLTEPYPGIPRRRIADLLKYDRNVNLEVQRHTLDFVVRELEDTTRSTSIPWAVEALGSVLAREGEFSSATSKTFKMGSFALFPFLGKIQERRTAALDCLTEIAIGSKPDEAATAVAEIAELLCQPPASFAREVTPEELSAWLPESKLAADRLAGIAKDASGGAIRYYARYQLRSTSKEHWPEVGEYIEGLLAKTPGLDEEPFFDCLIGIPQVERVPDWHVEAKLRKWRSRKAANELWESHPEPERIAHILYEAITKLGSVMRINHTDVRTLLIEMVKAKPEIGPSLARTFATIGSNQGPLLVQHVIVALKVANQGGYLTDLLREFSSSPYEELRAAVADVAVYPITDWQDAEEAAALLRPFLSDSSHLVKRAALRSLPGFKEKDVGLGLHLLLSVDWEDNLETATEGCDVLNSTYGLDPASLTDAQIDSLLEKIERLRSLEGSQQNAVLEFVAFASKRHPRRTVEMLVRRVCAIEGYEGKPTEERWTPIPYGGHGLSLPGLAQAAERLDLLRVIRDLALHEDLMVRFWSSVLFKAAVTGPTEAEEVLKEWVTSGDPLKVGAVAHLIRDFDHSTVFIQSEFIADLLDAAVALGSECLERTRGALFSLVLSGVYSRAPGQPSPRHVSDMESAEALVIRYKSRPAVKGFYDDVVRATQERIRHEIESDEEEDE